MKALRQQAPRVGFLHHRKKLRRSLQCASILLPVFASQPTNCAAQAPQSAVVSETSAPGTLPPLASPEVLQWLEQTIRRNLPPTYEDDRKWGKQKEVWDGIKLRREGLKLETERRKKLVNAGTWTRYAISIVEPEKNLHIRFNDLRTEPDGSVSFSITVDCSLDVFGRLSQWVRDVQLISISANADAACRLLLEGKVAFGMNPLALPPTFFMKPKIERAHIDLTYYRVRRISQIGGDFAKVLGNGLREVLDEKLEEFNSKLVDKINQQLDKHSDKLSFSAQQWLETKFPMPKTRLQTAEDASQR